MFCERNDFSVAWNFLGTGAGPLSAGDGSGEIVLTSKQSFQEPGFSRNRTVRCVPAPLTRAHCCACRARPLGWGWGSFPLSLMRHESRHEVLRSANFSTLAKKQIQPVWCAHPQNGIQNDAGLHTCTAFLRFSAQERVHMLGTE